MARKKLTPEEIKQQKQKLIERLLKYCINGEAPSTTAPPEVCALSKACHRYWNSWAEFCRAAGVKPKIPNYNSRYKRITPQSQEELKKKKRTVEASDRILR